MKPSLLIVEDDKSFARTLALEFSDRGYETAVVHSLADLEALSPEAPRFAIVDLRLGADNGLSAVEKILTLSPACRIVMLTGYGSIATAVKAVKLGAANYLTKPAAMELIEKALWVDLAADEGVPASLARHEREYIEFVLAQCGGNITKAADWLGLHRQSLQRKLRKYPPSV